MCIIYKKPVIDEFGNVFSGVRDAAKIFDGQPSNLITAIKKDTKFRGRSFKYFYDSTNYTDDQREIENYPTNTFDYINELD